MTVRHNAFGQPVGDAVDAWTGAPFPPGATLTGRLVTLRPLEPGDAGALWSAWEGTSEADWTYLPMERPTGVDGTRVVVDEMVGAPTLAYAVLVAGEPAGVLSLMRVDPANGVLEVGAVVLGTPLRRTAGSTEAHRLLMGHVVEDLGYRRVEWKCDVLNAPSMAAAERLGYTFEGVFRNAVVTKGRNRDTAWWSVTGAEWPQVRARLDAWLDPANFGADGRQLRPLARRTGA
ncbi:GNAT family N-acetyltransferase [Oryzobacter terrae]|uniref:GNAT family N-acetyltransferase n=1 Tax=Oryzobacter terrae TaxID=1620385 RepID=UPI00366F371C